MKKHVSVHRAHTFLPCIYMVFYGGQNKFQLYLESNLQLVHLFVSLTIGLMILPVINVSEYSVTSLTSETWNCKGGTVFEMALWMQIREMLAMGRPCLLYAIDNCSLKQLCSCPCPLPWKSSRVPNSCRHWVARVTVWSLWNIGTTLFFVVNNVVDHQAQRLKGLIGGLAPLRSAEISCTRLTPGCAALPSTLLEPKHFTGKSGSSKAISKQIYLWGGVIFGQRIWAGGLWAWT